MGHSQADKAQSRERILQNAADQIRDAGLESVSVARLMRSADLTHGGFYGHFASRADLLAHALDRALVDGAAASRAATRQADAARAPASANLDRFIRSYLSRSHRDARASGCAVAALAADAARADEPVRAVMAEHLERFFSRVADLAEVSDEQAMFAVSALVGGLLLSRVLAGDARSDDLLKSVREGLADWAAQAPEGGAQR